jgi:hypothetical protein
MMVKKKEKTDSAKGRWILAAALGIAAMVATSCENRVLEPDGAEAENQMAADARGFWDEYSQSPFPPITDIYILISSNKSAQPPEPYKRLDSAFGYCPEGDLNEKAGGKFIYLCYTDDPNYGAPITGLYVYSGKKQTHYPNPGYFHVSNSDGFGPTGSRGADLNKGAGGDFIYLLAKRADGEAPIRNLYLEVTDRKQTDLKRYERIWNNWDLTWLPNDLNKGAGGRYIYLAYNH